MVFFLAAILLAGCSTMPSRPKRYSYRGFADNLTIIVADQETVDRKCFMSGATEDDMGRPVPPYDHYAGCYTPVGNTIYVSEKYPDTIFHEMCHASGEPKEKCVDY